MVKLIGPMMSISASGKFADTMVFAKKGGTAYARQRVVPFNPKSAAQTGNRALMKFLTQIWSTIDPSDQATWAALAASMTGVNFNAFIHYNMLNWKQFYAPSNVYPRTGTGTLPSGSSQTAQGQVGQAFLFGTAGTVNDGWGIMIFRDTVMGFTPAPNNLVSIQRQETGATAWSFIDSPLQPGTYYYNYINFTTGGNKSSSLGEDTVTVT